MTEHVLVEDLTPFYLSYLNDLVYEYNDSEFGEDETNDIDKFDKSDISSEIEDKIDNHVNSVVNLTDHDRVWELNQMFLKTIHKKWLK